MALFGCWFISYLYICKNWTLSAQSFISLKADLLKEINVGSEFSRSLHWTFVWNKSSVGTYLNSKEKICICYSSHLGHSAIP